MNDNTLMQARMDEHLSNTKWDIRAALQRFEEIGFKIDRRFRRDFIKQTTDCVIDTCEKYGSGSKDKTSHKEKHFELHSDEVDKRSHSKRKSLKDGVKQNEPKKTCSTKGSPFERRKQEADDPTEDRKRRKLNKEIVKKEVVEVCNFDMDDDDKKPNLQFPTMFFYCTHCVDETGEAIGGSIEDAYKHWMSTHFTANPSKPFQFYVAEIAVCHLQCAIGTYNELRKHQQQVHPNEPFAIVSCADRRKCAICLKVPESMVDHFKSEHDMILEKEFFNPMQLCDTNLNDLLQIDIHKKQQCGHCDGIFETEDAIELHHELKHETSEKLYKQYNEEIFLICGYCQRQVTRDDYFNHFRAHPYALKCWNCIYESKDLTELIMHDKEVHDRNTLDYHCSMFSDWIKTHFTKTKTVFPNGLVLHNYNLVATKFDDSKIFDMFIQGMVELTKSVFHLLNKVKDGSVQPKPKGKDTSNKQSPVTSEDAAPFLAELEKQNEIANNLLILKLPRIGDMDLRDMFLKLCNKLKLKVKSDDIQNICRRPRDGRDDTLVSLTSYELKEEIRSAAQKHSPVYSGDLFDLHNTDQWSKPIKIISHTTRYYSEMLAIAKEARSDRVIFHYELTKRGVHIKRSSTSDDRIFISKTELLNFINRCRQMQIMVG